MKTSPSRLLAIAEWLQDPKNQAAIPHQLARCGYVPVCNPDTEDGREREVIYSKAALSPEQRLEAARKMVRHQ